jgi:hypothetical protein
MTGAFLNWCGASAGAPSGGNGKRFSVCGDVLHALLLRETQQPGSYDAKAQKFFYFRESAVIAVFRQALGFTSPTW